MDANTKFVGSLFYEASSFVCFVLVDTTFFRVWSKCPFTVAWDTLYCIHTFLLVIPGHILKYPLFIALIHVACVGMNSAACTYATNFGMVEDWCTLLHCKSVGVGVGTVFNGKHHNPVISSCAPTNNVLCCFVIITYLLSNVASHPASHILPIVVFINCACLHMLITELLFLCCCCICWNERDDTWIWRQHIWCV